MADVSRPASDLYGLPLERFTEERNALARRLRQQGRREEAAEVAKLRKPSVAAWAVNQLVRTQRREIDALFAAGDALQKSQADVLSGRGDAGSLRAAADAERAALDRLGQKARGLLTADGHELTPAKLEQVSDTLHAAALDEEARDRVSDGCLDRELRHVGLGALGAGGAKAPRRTALRRSRDERAAKLKVAREAEAAARREMERAQRDVDAAQGQLERATREHERAKRALDELG